MEQNNNKDFGEPIFTIIHFNDVYDIQPKKDGSLGIVNFEAYLKQLKAKYPNSLTLFSGDAFSPSALTNIYEGKQMVKSLNALGIDAACYGNHEFDLQQQITLQLSKQCNFPWLLGNITYKDSNFLLGDGQKFIIKQLQCGLRIGIFGVAGEDWIGILDDSYEDQLQYEHFAKFSKQITQILLTEHKCDMIIALTHMRVPSDEALPQEVPEIDLILGGHDHIIYEKSINDILVVKSGDNFKTVRQIHIYDKSKSEGATYQGRKYNFQTTLTRIPITSNPNQQLQNYVQKCMEQYTKHDRVIGWTDVALQTRFKNIRTSQTNFGNFVADLVRLYFDNQIVILNSGAFRMDSVINPGPLRYSTVSNYINDIIVIKTVKGNILLEALQYACSSCPNVYAGSFLQVSGISFTFDYRKNPRVQQVFVGEQTLDIDRSYSVAAHSYMANGGDGFNMLKNCPFQLGPTASIDIISLILKFFKSSQAVYSSSTLLDESEIELMNIKSNEGEIEEDKEKPFPVLNLVRKPSIKILRILQLRKRTIMTEDKVKFVSIAPAQDGRIKSLYP